MKNFTLKIFTFMFLGFVAFQANAQEWNISGASFSSLGTITETTTVDGLTIYATADASVTVDANNKSLDGMDFTSRLKLGGSGTFDTDGNPVSRVLAFPVTGNTTIKVAGMSSSSGSDRQLYIVTKTDTIGIFAALGTPITSGEFVYTGGPTTIYLYSASSGVNIYSIKTNPINVGIHSLKASEMTVYPNPASGKVYINARQTSVIGIYSMTGQLVKQQQVDPSQNSIDISNLHSGLYLVKMMDTEGKAQKLIVQ